jgi:hypothetical protein
MGQLTIDRTLLAQLLAVKEAVEIVDPDGKVVGRFTPTGEHRETTTVEEARRIFDLDRAKETLARERDQGRPLKEILERLKAGESLG